MIKARRAMLAVPLLLAACSTAGPQTTAGPTPAGTSAASSPTATSTPASAATSAATDAPASTPEPVPTTATTPAASLDDLESLIPTEIAGNEMTIEPASDPTRSFMILWNEEQVAQDLLDSLDASSSEIDVVFSYPTGDFFPNRVSVDAYQVAGADGTALRDGMVENYRAFLAEHANVEVTEESVGGKDVVLLSLPDSPGDQGNYFYSVGDIVFMVSGTPFEWVEDAFAQLP